MGRLVVPVTKDDHIQGDGNADVTLLEYGDFQCPHCKAANHIVKQLQSHFGDRMRYIYRNFPLMQIHRMAEPAAEAAECVGSHGRYWQMHDAIFANQDMLSPEMLIALGRRLRVEGEELEEAMEEQYYLDRITRDTEGGERAGVHGTPTFFINGQQYQGSWEFEDLAAAMEAA